MAKLFSCDSSAAYEGSKRLGSTNHIASYRLKLSAFSSLQRVRRALGVCVCTDVVPSEKFETHGFWAMNMYVVGIQRMNMTLCQGTHTIYIYDPHPPHLRNNNNMNIRLKGTSLAADFPMAKAHMKRLAYARIL